MLAAAPCAVLAEIPEVVTNRDRFEIPFDFDSSRLAALGAESVELYVARNGERWELVDTTTPDHRAFLYQAGSEGEYSFCVRAKTQDGSRIPNAPLSASLSVTVDQTAPRLDARQSVNDEAITTVEWRISDATLDLSSIKVETRSDRSAWSAIDAPQVASGSVGVRSSSAREIRIVARDQAGNDVEWAQPLSRLAVVNSSAGKSSDEMKSTRPAMVEARLASANQPVALPATKATSRATANQPASLSAPSLNADVNTGSVPRSVQVASATADWTAPQVTPKQQSANFFPTSEPLSTQTAMLPGHSISAPHSRNDVRPAHGRSDNSWAVAVTKRVKTHTFRLGYELEDVGPSGLSTVALYITEDHGRSWFHYGNDPDASSPMDVTVPNDGTYGFSFRVMSGTGFGDLPPQPGERPDVAIAVDQTPPTINMLPLGHSQGANSHQLAIRWTAHDQTLPPRPVRVEYGPSPSGPWTPVAPPLANTGEFVWDVSQPMPGAVYLRVSITDAAGNTANDFTREPIMLDFSRPAARITAIEAITN